MQFSQGEKVPIVGQTEVRVVPLDMTNGENIEALFALARTMTNQVNRGIEPGVNTLESIMTSRLRDFVRMNPSIYLGSKAGEDP